MNVFLLMVALAAPVEAPKAGLHEAYAQGRFLSAPWSARRRLEAARIRGDEDEARRIETMMDTLVVEALATEGP